MSQTIHKTDDELEVYVEYLIDKFEDILYIIAKDISEIALENNICYHNIGSITGEIAASLFRLSIDILPEPLSSDMKSDILDEMIRERGIDINVAFNNPSNNHIH